MAEETFRWEDYYKKLQGRVPHRLLILALEKFPVETSFHATDLGCGDGTETVLLLERGWHVLAVDGEAAAIQYLLQKVPRDHLPRLQTKVAKFEDVNLSRTDLIYAGFSIPFCHPAQFPALWERITYAIKPGGRFAGQFFGVRDSWAADTEKTFHTGEQVRTMLESFEIELFEEQDEDGVAASGPKHWHVFSIIAKKK